MKINKSRVDNILFITLSNIGDAVLTLPVLEALKRNFIGADITVMSSLRTRELFEADPSVSKIIVYNKHMSLYKKLQLGLRLRRSGFDLVVDLRHSFFPLIIGSRYRTACFRKKRAGMHKRDKHLKELEPIGIKTESVPFLISVGREDKLNVTSLLTEYGLLPEDNIVAIAAGAKSHIKQWQTSGFIRLSNKITKEMGFKVILIGDINDAPINDKIKTAGLNEVYDFTGKTNLRELAYLLSLCKVLVTNDSAPLHIASAQGIPTVAIFGPTDEKKYGPLAPRSIVIRKNLRCSPCEKASCRFDLECMKEISADEVFNSVRDILARE